MAGNELKTPLGKSLSAASRARALDMIQLTGKALPCSVVSVKGAIVKVKFEIGDVFTLPAVTIPIAGSIYLREPIQVGDKGMVIPADAYLGGVSGLGGGTADLSQRANLTALQFHPIGNANWPATPDANAMLVQGPNGAIVRDMGGACVFTLTPSGVVLKVGGVTFTFSAAGLAVAGGDVKADTISLKTHKNTGVMSGGALTGPPAP